MQNDINFDNYVKNTLHNHKSPVPNGLWDKIVAEKETKKPVAFWWTDKRWYMVAAACLILICGTCLLIRNKNSIDASLTTKVPNLESANSNNTSTTNKAQTIDNNTTLNQNNNNANNSNGSVLKNDADVANKTSSNLTTNKTVNPLVVLPKVNSKTKGTKILRKNVNIDAANNFSQQPPTTLQTDVKAQDYSNDIIAKFTEANTVSFSKLFNYNTKDITSLKLKNQNRIFGLDCPNTKPATWYLEAYGSADYTTKSINSYGVSDNYLQRIDSTTKMNGGFTFGLRISKTISDNLLIKSGLQFTQRNEQFTSKSDSIITTTSVVTVRTIVRGGGLSDTTVRDTATVQQIGYRKRITNNHYKSIEVPLLLSYERSNDQWRFAINGGIIANLTSWYNGETLDTSFQLVPLGGKNANGFYKSNLNLSLYAGVSIMKRVNDRMDVFAEPYFRYGISNTNTSAAGYSQRFNAAGLSLGIRYKLNNKGSVLSN